MNTRRSMLVPALSAVLLAGCSTSGHPAEDPQPTTKAPQVTPGPTIAPGADDGGVVPVSLSNLSADAQVALERCLVDPSSASKSVDSMGLVGQARDVPRYVPLTGLEPEIQTTAPAWVVQLKGEFPQLRGGEIWTDPVCVVIGETFGLYATGPVTDMATGKSVAPMAPESPPDLVLPKLQP
jgi:hypothetical protein